MAKSEAKIRFTADTREFTSQIQNADSTMRVLRAELRQNETQMKATGSTVEGLQRSHELLSNQYEIASAKTEAMRRKLDAAIRIYGEGSTEVNRWRTQLANAETAEEQLRQAVEQCSDALDEQQNYTEAVNEGFAKMGDTITDLAKGGFVAIAGAVGAVGTVAVTTATDIDKATNTFIAKTGESVDSAEEFENAMVSIYNGGYGESFEDISESMATVKTALGDIGTAELENVTTKALVMRDTFDMDVNESIRAVNSMMDQFGITADDAYNLIAQGAQNGLNQNGDLLDTVNEYSVQFKNAGYSAEDMFNMLANGVDSGTWSVDKLGDAVKEFNIRASDGTVSEAIKKNAKAFGMTKTEAEALATEVGQGSVGAYQKLADQLRSVDDDTQRYQLGVSMFGTMWEDLGEDAVFALLDTQGEISTTTDALEQIDSVKYDDLGSAIEGIKRNLQTSVTEPIKDEVMPAVNEFVEDVDWQGVGQTIGDVMGVGVEGVLSFANGIKSAVVWMNEHKALCAGVAAAIGIIATAIVAYNVVQAVKTAMDAAQVTTVWALVAAYWAQSTAAMAAIAPYVLVVAVIAAVIAIIIICVKHWDKFVDACKKAWEKVKSTLSKWGSWINTNVVNPVVRFFKDLWSSIKSIWTGIKESVSQATQKALSTVSNIWNKLKSATLNAFNACKSAASSAWNSLKSAVTNAVNSVKSKVSSVWNSIKSTTSSIFQSCISVVTDKFGKIKSKISDTINGAKNVVKTGIEKIKSFFNFNWSLPKIKLPHFEITGKFSLNPPSIPKFSVEWYKTGAIFTKPTIFNTPYGLKGVGEAGAEAVLPIAKLEHYVSNAVEKAQNVVGLDRLAQAVEDLANRPIEVKVNDRVIATATAGANDKVNGLRSTFASRGLILE